VSILEDLQGEFLDAPCMAYLGDTIGYKAAAASTFTAMHAYVDYTDAVISLDGGQVIAQDISAQALRSDIPVKPSAACRVTMARIPGATFKPINVRSDESGRYWNFELQLVPNA